ncbi:hypothetical protein [Oribacterium sp. P6A1]|uniref:hypothetical protein n=1 Tax=Oribacterium sp. P6A1 TaxID=1410612 RepID=UPI001FA78D2D
MQEFNITRRMLQRDLKDIRDSGLLNTKLDRANNSYVKIAAVAFDEKISDRRKAHLIRLYRIGTLIWSLPHISKATLHMYENKIEEYEYALQESLDDPKQYPPEYLPDKPELPEFPDLKAQYYELFPDSNERTRQRDFEELNRAGFRIYYERKYKAFFFECDEYTGELMDI